MLCYPPLGSPQAFPFPHQVPVGLSLLHQVSTGLSTLRPWDPAGLRSDSHPTRPHTFLLTYLLKISRCYGRRSDHMAAFWKQLSFSAWPQFLEGVQKWWPLLQGRYIAQKQTALCFCLNAVCTALQKFFLLKNSSPQGKRKLSTAG